MQVLWISQKSDIMKIPAGSFKLGKCHQTKNLERKSKTINNID